VSELGGQSVSSGGIAVGTLQLTAAQMRAFSLAGNGPLIIPSISGKRITVLALIGWVTGQTVPFTGGVPQVSAISNNPSFTGSNIAWAVATKIGFNDGVHTFPFATDTELSGITSTVDPTGEGIYIFPSSYSTVGADGLFNFSVLYQYL
jgi:hypothetical protein